MALFDTENYNEIIRKTIVAFGNLFSNIKVNRKNKTTGLVSQTISVPIAYGPKEKQITRTESDPSLDNKVYTIIPRITFEILGYTYDPERKVNRLSKIKCDSVDGTRSSMFSPVPYNLEVQMYVTTKNTEDGLQILEQILPLFSPEYTLSINAVPEFNLIQNIPIVLNSVVPQDDYDGDLETRRFVLHTFSFTIKLNIYGVSSDQGTINKVIVPFPDQAITYTATGTNPIEPIVEVWLEEDF